ncbi:MAG TPA: 50S ribosomal protein L9 [Candidatus Paceibacterota bacterium]|nr:50S ribosomal protein L9 [Candidatus Paceibacterota bacterium]
MKVVLLKDVRDMGRAHTTIEVSDGHALNYLIPRKLAVPATSSALKQAEVRVKQVVDRKELDVKLVEERLAALAEEKIVIRKKANEQGHLYDGVDAREIAAAANLPEEVIRIEKPFKELGTFEVPVSFGENFGKIAITVEAE